jgi:hypothetical protein
MTSCVQHVTAGLSYRLSCVRRLAAEPYTHARIGRLHTRHLARASWSVAASVQQPPPPPRGQQHPDKVAQLHVRVTLPLSLRLLILVFASTVESPCAHTPWQPHLVTPHADTPRTCLFCFAQRGYKRSPSLHLVCPHRHPVVRSGELPPRSPVFLLL